MTSHEFVGLLDGARSTPRGWIARCPVLSHNDRSPSLSVGEGKGGRILLHCWAGCQLAEICSALNIQLRDLFPCMERDRSQVRALQKHRLHEQRIREEEWRRKSVLTDAQREAERLIRSAQGIDTSAWSDDFMDAMLNKLADAYDFVGDGDE